MTKFKLATSLSCGLFAAIAAALFDFSRALPALAQMPPGPESMEPPPVITKPDLNLEAAAIPAENLNVVEGSLKEKRLNVLRKIMAAKAHGIGITPYMSAFNFVEEMVKAKDSEANIEKRLTSIDDGLNDQLKRSVDLKTQRPTPPVAAGSPMPSAQFPGMADASSGDIINKLKNKFGGKIPGNIMDKLPPGIADKFGGDPSQLLNDPNLKDLLKGLKN